MTAAPDSRPRRGLMLVLSSPSGAGKTTISRALLEKEQNLSLSVSVTTRPPRPSETDGVDYHFVTPERFEAMRAGGDLLEWAVVFGNSYGTPRSQVADALETGRDVLFDVDWQGTQQLNEAMEADLVSVFILPPSADELERRLRSRAQDSDEVIAGRMARASDELSHWSEYQYLIVNDDLNTSVQRVRTILHAERLRRRRQVAMADYVRTMRDQLELDS